MSVRERLGNVVVVRFCCVYGRACIGRRVLDQPLLLPRSREDKDDDDPSNSVLEIEGNDYRIKIPLSLSQIQDSMFMFPRRHSSNCGTLSSSSPDDFFRFLDKVCRIVGLVFPRDFVVYCNFQHYGRKSTKTIISKYQSSKLGGDDDDDSTSSGIVRLQYPTYDDVYEKAKSIKNRSRIP
mmetsp:Transcript_10594/g.25276  ORF Transcript_10594/g.25276 Transcript_10594/m.25276 type:complete len:180 (-) Transcript_10594:209-748(-)